MVVNHSPAVAFAAANVGFPKICVSPLFRNQNVYMLHACLATLIRICLILYQYRSRRSLRLLLSKIIANSGMILLLHFGAMGIAPQYIRCTPSAIGVPASSISSLSAGVGTQRSPPTDWERLTNTIQARRPRLLILDPLIRLHRVDENDASQIAALLSYLRQLQRTFQVAVLVVHHARKDASATRPGQALRGSSELHGWGDSNLYMRRRGPQLTLSTEHRAAASQDHIPLQLTQAGSALALSVAAQDSSIPEPGSESGGRQTLQRIQQILAGLDQPVTVQQLRKLCGLRTTTVCSCLAQLADNGVVTRDSRGYQLNRSLQSPAVSLSPPIGPQGNGNGKHSP